MMDSPSRPLLVIGAGTMGAGIAQVAAAAGDTVFLCDQMPDAPQRALDRIAASLERAAAKGHLTKDSAQKTLELIKPQATMDCAAGCGVVIEAVKEDQTIKQSVFHKLEGIVSQSTWLCTNTSMISITALASVLNDKSRFCGTHFFNPVPRMKLVEVIAGRETSAAAIEAARSMVTRWGKTAVLAPDSPGFIVNRVFDAIKREALSLHEQGVDVAQIDQALRLGLNFPMGPFELMDLIGLDTTYDCLINQARQMNRVPEFGRSLPNLVAAGRYGCKSGSGFYEHNKEN